MDVLPHRSLRAEDGHYLVLRSAGGEPDQVQDLHRVCKAAAWSRQDRSVVFK